MTHGHVFGSPTKIKSKSAELFPFHSLPEFLYEALLLGNPLKEGEEVPECLLPYQALP